MKEWFGASYILPQFISCECCGERFAEYEVDRNLFACNYCEKENLCKDCVVYVMRLGGNHLRACGTCYHKIMNTSEIDPAEPTNLS